MFSAGHFTDCQNFHHIKISGKYCVAYLKASKPIDAEVNHSAVSNLFHEIIYQNESALKQGVCMPEICSEKFAKKINDFYLKDSSVTWNALNCYKQPQLQQFDFVFM